MDPLAVPAAPNPLLKQGPDSPVSVFDFERRKTRSRSKSEYPGLYPPPRPPRKSSTSPPSRNYTLRRSQSQPLGSPRQGCSRDGHLQHQLSANVLSELNNAGSNVSYGRTLDFESVRNLSVLGSPPVGKVASTNRGFSPLSGKENHDSQGKRALGTRGWNEEVNESNTSSEIEGAGPDDGRSTEKKRTCPGLQNMSPFSIWSNMQGQPRALEHRKMVYSPVKADDVEEVFVNINLQKVGKKDLQLNPRESRRLVLLFILFNLLFGGLLVFRIPRAGESGLLTPRITRPEQLLNLHGNFGARLHFYRRLVGPRERLVAVDPLLTQISSESGTASGQLQGEPSRQLAIHPSTVAQQTASASGVRSADVAAA